MMPLVRGALNTVASRQRAIDELMTPRPIFQRHEKAPDGGDLIVGREPTQSMLSDGEQAASRFAHWRGTRLPTK